MNGHRASKPMSCENVFGETIYSYSRQQAIEDGVLVDLSHNIVIRQHWKHPFACTDRVWALIERALTQEGQDLNGILHDVSVMSKRAVPRGQDCMVIRFEVIIMETKHALKLHVGPGDNAEPVLTLMFPHED
jgi:hypothetical protein